MPLRILILILIHAVESYFHDQLFINQYFYRTILLLNANSESFFKFYFYAQQTYRDLKFELNI